LSVSIVACSPPELFAAAAFDSPDGAELLQAIVPTITRHIRATDSALR